jgi:predicted small metal-binding protein
MLPTPLQRPWRSIRLGKEVTPVAKIMQCDCGYVVRGETDDELVANVQKHAREVHAMEITREQVLAMAQQR